MLPSDEGMLYSVLTNASSELRNNSQLNAYPMLVPVLNNLAGNLDNAIHHALGIMRKGMFDGTSPWAKLYTLTTGKEIRIPDMKMLGNLAASSAYRITLNGLDVMFDYFIKHWDNPDADEEFIIHSDDPMVPEQIVINLKTKKATFFFTNNDLKMELDAFYSTNAAVTSPLFHEPYLVVVDSAWQSKWLAEPVFEHMLGLYGASLVTYGSPKDVLHEHYYGTKDAPIEVGGDAPILLLTSLFSLYTYTKHGLNTTTYEWNGYRLVFSNVRDYFAIPYDSIAVDVQAETGTDGYFRTVNDWHKNPFLVHDLRKDLDGIIARLLELHDLSMKEQ